MGGLNKIAHQVVLPVNPSFVLGDVHNRDEGGVLHKQGSFTLLSKVTETVSNPDLANRYTFLVSFFPGGKKWQCDVYKDGGLAGHIETDDEGNIVEQPESDSGNSTLCKYAYDTAVELRKSEQ